MQCELAARGELAIDGDQVLHGADLGRQHDALPGHAELDGTLGAAQRRAHDGLAHDLLAREWLGGAAVLVHHAHQQILIEAAPVHADAHRLAVGAGNPDHLGELRVALGAAADVARVDAVLGQRLGAGRVFLEELVAVEMEVPDQRHIAADRVQTMADVRHGGSGFVRVHGDAHQLRAGGCQLRALIGGGGHVGRVGVGHRLHDDRRDAADRDVPNLHRTGQMALWSHAPIVVQGAPGGPNRCGTAAPTAIMPPHQAESWLGRHTCLFDLHVELGARMVDFGGWDMPVAYGSQIEEHHAVRRAAGVFDISHMGIVDLRGDRCRELLRELLANDVGRLNLPGKALYSCMLNEQGGVLDDLIVYYLDDDFFRLVVNAAPREKDLAWIGARAGRLGITLRERRDLAMLAIQGPQARERSAALLHADAAWAVLELQPFFGAQIGEWFVARTGYTGEDGFEIMLPGEQASSVWQRLNAAGVQSCGLGARDTLRLEAGMNLYGNDMDEDTNPFESGLAWTVAMQPHERHFIGREALEKVLEQPTSGDGAPRQLVGLVLEDRGV